MSRLGLAGGILCTRKTESDGCGVARVFQYRGSFWQRKATYFRQPEAAQTERTLTLSNGSFYLIIVEIGSKDFRFS